MFSLVSEVVAPAKNHPLQNFLSKYQSMTIIFDNLQQISSRHVYIVENERDQIILDFQSLPFQLDSLY